MEYRCRMHSVVQVRMLVILIATVGVSCSSSNGARIETSLRQAKPILIAEKTAQVSEASSAAKPDQSLVERLQISEPDCDESGICVPYLIEGGGSASVETASSGMTNQTDEIDSGSSAEEPESSGRSGGSVNQVSVHPNGDLDLIQLPDEDSYQAVNSLWTSSLPNNSVVSQTAEYKDVTFNQLRSPSALHTINSLRHDDHSKNGSLTQSFKFKSLEMIQQSAGDSMHSMNYVGD